MSSLFITLSVSTHLFHPFFQACFSLKAVRIIPPSIILDRSHFPLFLSFKLSSVLSSFSFPLIMINTLKYGKRHVKSSDPISFFFFSWMLSTMWSQSICRERLCYEENYSCTFVLEGGLSTVLKSNNEYIMSSWNHMSFTSHWFLRGKDNNHWFFWHNSEGLILWNKQIQLSLLSISFIF